MNNLNSILIEGNLTKDPETAVTPKGTQICRFSVATNRYYKLNDEQQREVSFFNVESWSTLASTCSTYLKKGRGVRIVGRLKQIRWLGGDGKHHDRIVIVAEHVEFKPQYNCTPEQKIEQEEEVAKVTAEVDEALGVPDPASAQDLMMEDEQVTCVAESADEFEAEREGDAVVVKRRHR